MTKRLDIGRMDLRRKDSWTKRTDTDNDTDNVLNSQSTTRDGKKIPELKGETVATEKAVSRNTAASKSTAKNTVTRSSVMSTGQSSHVLQGLKELKDLQQQSPSSMNDMISTMKSAMETFT